MKSGFVVLVGRSNVGKSTLLNALVGTKIAITSPKPQTTRFPIHGIINDERGQIVFVDTPGVFAKARDPVTSSLNQHVRDALRDIDLVVYVADPTRAIGNEENMMLRLVEPVKAKKILAINKIDEHRPPYIEEYRNLSDRFDATVEISALHHKNLKQLVSVVFDMLSEGEAHYPEFQFTNIDNRVWVAEIIREKVFIQMGQEIPYSVAVEIEDIEERKQSTPSNSPSKKGEKTTDILYVKANIVTNAERYKGMLVGSGGRKIKEMGASARRELEGALNRRVFLDLQVVVDPQWTARLL